MNGINYVFDITINNHRVCVIDHNGRLMIRQGHTGRSKFWCYVRFMKATAGWEIGERYESVKLIRLEVLSLVSEYMGEIDNE